MSRKYFDRLLVADPVTNKKVKSKFGLQMLKKMGWNEGQGLGLQNQGRVDCIQAKRRPENLGLGSTIEKKDAIWGGAHFEDIFNSVAQRISSMKTKDEKERRLGKMVKKERRKEKKEDRKQEIQRKEEAKQVKRKKEKMRVKTDLIFY